MSKTFLRRVVSSQYLLLWAVSLITAVITHTALAPDTALALDGQWQGTTNESLTVDGKVFDKKGEAPANNAYGVPTGTKVYQHISGGGTADQKAHFVFFPANANLANEKNATYVVYKNAPPDKFTEPTTPVGLTITAANTTQTACDSRFTFGIGWMVCPIMNFFANAMDWMFEQLANFLVVRPVQTTTDNPLYKSWQIMQSIANVAFVIAFMIIIYSQITNYGISNYEIKKMLPRLIVAAILVNISYWVCALLVDLSNVMGYSVHDLFVGMRTQITGSETNSWQVVNWASITSTILSGGAAAGGIAALGVGLAAGGGAAIFQLIPTLLVVMLAVLVALFVLIARQALITIFIIVSPLAFVAYLLPNTEKWFDKWRSAFFTLLVMFPLFAVIFGGSQLAGIAIIKSATSINMILLGMAVQVAPVVITPLLVKFSGATISRFAGMVNNKNKGFIDRTRKWADEKSEYHKAAVLAGERKVPMLGDMARKIDSNKRKRDRMKSIYGTKADVMFANSKLGRDLMMIERDVDEDKKLAEARNDAAYNRVRTTNTAMVARDFQTRNYNEASNALKAHSDLNYENLKAGAPRPQNAVFNNMNNYATLQTEAVNAATDTSLTDYAKRAAQANTTDNFAKLLEKNGEFTLTDGSLINIREYAGGVKAYGADSALAAARSIQREQTNKAIGEYTQLIKHANPSSNELRQVLLNVQDSIELRDEAGNVITTVSGKNEFARDAIAENIIPKQTVSMLDELIIQTGKNGVLHGERITIAEGMQKSGFSGKSIYQGGYLNDLINQGKINDESDLNAYVLYQILEGKFSAAQLSNLDTNALKRFQKAISMDKDLARERLVAFYGPEKANFSDNVFSEKIASLAAKSYEAFTHPNLSGNNTDGAEKPLSELVNFAVDNGHTTLGDIKNKNNKNGSQ